MLVFRTIPKQLGVLKNVQNDSKINSQARPRGSVNLIREKTKNRLHCQSNLTNKPVEVKKIVNTKRLRAVLINARSIRYKGDNGPRCSSVFGRSYLPAFGYLSSYINCLELIK